MPKAISMIPAANMATRNRFGGSVHMAAISASHIHIFIPPHSAGRVK